MSPRPARRLILADIVVLVAAVAAYLCLMLASREAYLLKFGAAPGVQSGYRVGLAIAPIALSCSAALIVARALKPRPRWRRVFRQPGTLACVVIQANLVANALLLSAHEVAEKWIYGSSYRSDLNDYLFVNASSGFEIAVAWATLAMAGVWHPEKSWIDRSGRSLGVVSILYYLVFRIFR